MAEARRGHRDDSIYFDHRVGTACLDSRSHRNCAGRWRGVHSLGFAPDGTRLRRKVSGPRKTDVKDKLQALHEELRDGLRTSATYTVRQAINDWLADGLDGRAPRRVYLPRGTRPASGSDRLSQAARLDCSAGQVCIGQALCRPIDAHLADSTEQSHPSDTPCRGQRSCGTELAALVNVPVARTADLLVAHCRTSQVAAATVHDFPPSRLRIAVPAHWLQN